MGKIGSGSFFANEDFPVTYCTPFQAAPRR